MAPVRGNFKNIDHFSPSFWAKNGKISTVFNFELVNKGWIIAILYGKLIDKNKNVMKE